MDFDSFLNDQIKAPGDLTAALQPGVDPALAPAPPAPADPFETFLSKAKGDQSTLRQAQATAVTNAQQNTGNAAAAAKLVPSVGLPQAAIETDVPRFQAEAKASANAALLAQSPILARWVAANPDAARVAQDELPKLGRMAELWDAGRQINTAVADAQDKYANWGNVWNQFKNMGGETVKGVGESYASSALATARVATTGPALLGLAGFDRPFLAMQPVIADAKAAMEANAVSPDAGISGNVAHALGSFLGLMSQVVLTGGAGVPSAIGGAAGLPATAGIAETLINAGTHATRSMAFPALTSAVNKQADVMEKTGDPWAAVRAGVADYLFTTAQGAVPFSAPGGVAARFATGAVSAGAISEGNRAAMNLLMPPELQTAFDPQAMLLQAFQGGLLASVMGPRASPEISATLRGIRQTYVDATKAETAQRDIGKVAALGEIAGQSELRTADPAAFHEFVKTVTDQSQLDAVWVNGKSLSEAFAQSKVDPELMPEVRKQMAEAAATGGDVRIPIADYATHIAGTDMEKALMPNMKAAPDGMTFSEGQAFYKDAAKNMTERAQQMAQDKQASDALAADKDQVRQQVLDQLTATGRNTDAVNKAYATLMSEFYATEAERVGVKPSELFARHGLKSDAGTEGEVRPVMPDPVKEKAIEVIRQRESVLQSLADCLAAA